MGARSSINESFQHQGPPGAREREAGAAQRKSFQRGSLANGASEGEIIDTKGAEDAKHNKEAIVGHSRWGRKPLQGRQELPGARAFKSRSLRQEQELLRVRTSRRDNAPGRESPAVGTSGEEIMDAKEAIGDRRRRERRQLQGGQEPPGVRVSRSRSLQEKEPQRVKAFPQ